MDALNVSVTIARQHVPSSAKTQKDLINHFDSRKMQSEEHQRFNSLSS